MTVETHLMAKSISLRFLMAPRLNMTPYLVEVNIFIPETTAPNTKVVRLLSQYMKNHAANKWMLVSTRFKEEGFARYHPISFTVSNNVTQKAASLLLKNCVHKSLPSHQDRPEDCSTQKCRIDSRPCPASQKINFNSQNSKKQTVKRVGILEIRQLNILIYFRTPKNRLDGLDEGLKKYISDLDSMDNFPDGAFDTTKLKKDMLYIYKSTLAGVLKRRNEALFKKTEIKYNHTKVDLYNEDT
ncbi:uncharacterized protein EV154DRAFT_478334 [Mucor mucedo]|uniref:uncharacterized protein n=1 Tax=Mucor mucedo TaxID=29922 RepID=UPI002220702E|nr:uncharacterized protein EV154DRAFT_478334 [Mucor mucedo]KAI7894357.1 hypothetical protein EV154DRAFT_478334 [Mucor mucedo]